jgi:ribosome-associated protein
MTQLSIDQSFIQTTILPLLEDHKAKDIILLDVSNITDITDSMIICTGNSSRHIKTLADYVISTTKKKGGDILGTEGEKEGEWVLIDLIHSIVHIMLPSIREFYNLEKLWAKH